MVSFCRIVLAFCLVSMTSVQTIYGSVPTSTTVVATRVLSSSAYLNCRVNPGNEATTISFEYGTTTAYGNTIAVSGTSSGSTTLFKTAAVTGLLVGVPYHFRVKSQNNSGTTFGQDQTFTTLSRQSICNGGYNTNIIEHNTGRVMAVGYNNGNLGDGTYVTRQLPIYALKGAYNGISYLGDNSSNGVIQVSGSGSSSCYLTNDGTVYAVGANSYGTLGDNTTYSKTTPVRVVKGAYSGTSYLGDDPNNPVIQISQSSQHTLFLTLNGNVYACGRNIGGELGDSSLTTRLAPIKVLKGAYSGTTYLGDDLNNPIIAISASSSHSMALAADGTVYAWGDNYGGALGINNTTSQLIPVKMLKGAYTGSTYLGDNSLNPVIAICAGNKFSLMATQDGKLCSVGENNTGQLGDNTTNQHETPVYVAKGEYNGTTYLGDDSTNRIRSIDCNYVHTIVSSALGEVYTFGYNNFGGLGDGSDTVRHYPVRVLKGSYPGTKYIGDDSENYPLAVSADIFASTVLCKSGKVYGFGHNSFGQLADSTTTQRNTPVTYLASNGVDDLNVLGEVECVTIQATQVYDSSANLNCRLTVNGHSYVAWFEYGSTNAYGHTAPITDTLNGFSSHFVSTKIEDLIPGQMYHYRAVTSSFSDTTYGANHVFVMGESSMDAGYHSVFLNMATGVVYSTGNNQAGELGDGTTHNRLAPVPVLKGAYNGTTYLGDNIDNPIVMVKSGYTTTFALAKDGTIYAWGANYNGMLGDGTTNTTSVPVRVLKGAYSGTTFLGDDPSNPVIRIAVDHSLAGQNGVLALMADGTVYGWGYNYYGNLGIGNKTSQTAPVQVLKGGYSGTTYLGDNAVNPIIDIGLHTFNGYALAADGSVYSFGNNANGQLGNGTATSSTEPVRVVKGAYSGTTYVGDNVDNPVVQLSVGKLANIACAIRTLDGSVFAFGNNSYGQLGDSTTTNRNVPIRVLKGAYNGTSYLGDSTDNGIINIGSGQYCFYAVSSQGEGYAYGQNSYGALGDGTSKNSITPVRILKGDYNGSAYLGDNSQEKIISIAGGHQMTLALSETGKLYSFGQHGNGGLGTDMLNHELLPTVVKGTQGYDTLMLWGPRPNPKTLLANRLYDSTAYLNCIVNGNGLKTLVSFEYGTTTSYGNTTTEDSTSDFKNTFITISVNDLVPGKIYHFRVKAVNKFGTSYGTDRQFSTGSSCIAPNLAIDVQQGTVHNWGSWIATGVWAGGGNTPSKTPVRVLKGAYDGTKYLGDNPNNPITFVASARLMFYAIGANGTVYSWGQNSGGELGDGTTSHSETPVRVLKGDYNGTTYLGDNNSNPVIKISSYVGITGRSSVMALMADGTVFAWSGNEFGQLGDGTTIDRASPVQVKKGPYEGTSFLGDDPNNPVIDISSSGSTNYALTADGRMYSFGLNVIGSLGNDTVGTSKQPHLVLKGDYAGTVYLGDQKDNPIIQISARKNGNSPGCRALSENGLVYGFGMTSGLRADSATSHPATPVKALKGAYSGTTYLGDDETNKVVDISTGYGTGFSLTTQGELYANGYNYEGQCGIDTSYFNVPTPLRVLKGTYNGTSYFGDNSSDPIIAFSLGNNSNVLIESGNIYAFGSNSYGELGDGTKTEQNSPVQVVSTYGYCHLNIYPGCTSNSDLPTTTSTTYASNQCLTDIDDWTHYCSENNKLLLSLSLGDSLAIVKHDEVQLKLGSSTTFSSTSSGGMITNPDGYVIIDRRWDVDPTTQPSTDTIGVRYYFSENEYDDVVTTLSNHTNSSNVTAVTQLNMYKASSGTAFADPHTVNGSIIYHGNIPNDSTWTLGSHGTDHYAEFGVTSFSGGGGGGGAGGGSGAGSLPVELLFFDANWLQDSVLLTWTTATEVNNKMFIIERLNDNGEFESVGNVKGNGTAQNISHYSFVDGQLPHAVKVLHYRLRQVDYDGGFDLSPVKTVTKNVHSSIKVFPNPVRNILYIRHIDNIGLDSKLDIMDLSGHIISSQNQVTHSHIKTYQYDMSDLPSGVYIVKIQTSSEIQTLKILKTE